MTNIELDEARAAIKEHIREMCQDILTLDKTGLWPENSKVVEVARNLGTDGLSFNLCINIVTGMVKVHAMELIAQGENRNAN